MNPLTRRAFLGSSLPALGVLTQAQAPRVRGANDRIAVGFVGLGGRGIGLLQMFARRPDVQVAWLCDPDRRRWARAEAAFEAPPGAKPRSTQDFRQILEDPAVDAVVIATPDHWHGLATILACQAGKDVYVEKPLAHNVREGRAMIQAARRHNRVVQVGTQSRSAPYVAAARDFIASGKLGDVHLVRVYNLMQHPAVPLGPEQPVPEGFDYDLWCGPAAKLPYHPNRRWLNYAEFSCGPIPGDAVHQLDLARFLMGDPPAPRTVSHTGGLLALRDGRDTPDTQIATYQFERFTLLFEGALWTSYMKKTPMEYRDLGQFPEWPWNATKLEVLGTEGFMVLGRHGEGWEAFDANHRPLGAQHGKQADREHIQDFFDAIRARRRSAADVEQGHLSTLLCHLANAAWHAGNRMLRFDPATESFPDTPAADAGLGRKYRAPWSLPGNA